MPSSGTLARTPLGRLRLLALALGLLGAVAAGPVAAGPVAGLGEGGAAEAAGTPIRTCTPFSPHAMTGFPQRGGTLVMCPH